MGLFDRKYMRGGPRYFPRNGTDMILKLIGVNAVVFLAVQIHPPLFDLLCLKSESIRSLQFHRLITAAFLHRDFWHIVLNMWGLYLFGKLAAIHLPPWKMLMLYLIGGVAGNVLFVLFNLQSVYILCGASGAVYAITMAAAMLEPNQRFVLIFMPFWPLKTSTMVICFTVLEVMSEAGGGKDNIAHLAHLGGFLGGYVAVRFLYPGRPDWDPFRALFGLGRAAGPGPGPGRGPVFRPRWEEPAEAPAEEAAGDKPVSQQQLDFLLDKIAADGINSLSESELSTLRRAREQMKRR
jgi:membrane associated rhomboid family serine protease